VFECAYNRETLVSNCTTAGVIDSRVGPGGALAACWAGRCHGSVIAPLSVRADAAWSPVTGRCHSARTRPGVQPIHQHWLGLLEKQRDRVPPHWKPRGYLSMPFISHAHRHWSGDNGSVGAESSKGDGTASLPYGMAGAGELRHSNRWHRKRENARRQRPRAYGLPSFTAWWRAGRLHTEPTRRRPRRSTRAPLHRTRSSRCTQQESARTIKPIYCRNERSQREARRGTAALARRRHQGSGEAAPRRCRAGGGRCNREALVAGPCATQPSRLRNQS